MKALLICEFQDGKLLEGYRELLGFAESLGVEASLLVIGNEAILPPFAGRIYLADSAKYNEFDPDAHKRLALAVVDKERPDVIALLHTSYGWDLAPRLAAGLKAALISEVVGLVEGGYEVTACNAKLRRSVLPQTETAVVTLQAGAFPAAGPGSGSPQVERIELPEAAPARIEFLGYIPAEKKDVDLTRAEVIVSAGRGLGKKENVGLVEALAKAFKGEVAATRPVVHAGWLSDSHLVGITGQTVAPKLYVACGISGATQHQVGMRKSAFIVAINKDRDAPIGELADVLVVADVLQFLPALTARLAKP
ncbi:MAG TPA: electron transfer flavoprotein subunit alpha/FixB family protein [Anaerolineales bacterium]|nr:electron transfer flavoprotein subunit alpha/FixB family protein [Anaerolineales bacterium]